MALHRQKSGGVVRLLAVALAIGMLATAGLLLVPSSRAVWTGAGLTVANSRYWGGHTFVPGETMTVTLTATPADSITLEVHNATQTLFSHAGISIPNTGTIPQSIVVQPGWPDGAGYTVVATDTTSGQPPRVVPFAIATYRLSVWSDRRGYIPGDGVTVTWSATYAQNGTQAPAGAGAIQVLQATGASLLTSRQFNLTASQGTLSFTLSTGVTAPQIATINAWFNDTAGLRHSTAGANFGIGNLGIIVTVAVPGRGYFEPGEYVPVAIQSTVTGIGGGVREPNVAVSVNVTDQATGLIVTGYSNTALSTDATGNLNYVFQLALSPLTGTYQVTATDSAQSFSATASANPFNVRPPPSFTATVTL
ncbi:MAG TPA: hypothetical protein VEY12_05210, partial [Thermoplasmata archaeon]|nr:hypothetical protein [Thermoplasmata archaeon]